MLNALLVAGVALAVAAMVSPDGTQLAHAASPRVVGQLVDPVLLRGIEDVHLDGDYAFLPCREGRRLTICSIEDPSHPTVVSSFTHAELDQAAGFAINGNTLYLASQGQHRLLVIDATNKSAPRFLGSVLIGEPGDGVLYKVAYRDGYCYVAHLTEKKLYVVDVRRPGRPVVVGLVAVTQEDDGPFSVLLRGDYALVGTIFGRRNRLAVVDVRIPAAPRLATQVVGPMIGQASGEVVDNLYFAVHWDTNALLVFDVADPAQPKLHAQLVDERLGRPNRCVIAGDRAYLPMTAGDGVAVVDIADPARPRFLTAFRDPALKKTYGAAVRDDLLFLGAREGNCLMVLDRQSLEK